MSYLKQLVNTTPFSNRFHKVTSAAIIRIRTQVEEGGAFVQNDLRKKLAAQVDERITQLFETLPHTEICWFANFLALLQTVD
jgi:hypothetical protein